MTPQEQILYYRKILLDETKSDTERRIAQKKLMELLGIKESNYNAKMEVK